LAEPRKGTNGGKFKGLARAGSIDALQPEGTNRVKWKLFGIALSAAIVLMGGITSTRAATSSDILIVHETSPLAFFGWYRASQMTQPGWDILQGTIDWAAPSAADVALFTYDATLSPDEDEDGLATYDYLVGAGYNVSVFSKMDITSGSYLSLDLAIYNNSFGYDATNLLNQGVPFISTWGSQADEMGIGDTKTSDTRIYTDRFYVLDNTHSITQTYAEGWLSFSSAMWTDSATASGNGVALVSGVPEPNTALLLASGLAGLAVGRRRPKIQPSKPARTRDGLDPRCRVAQLAKIRSPLATAPGSRWSPSAPSLPILLLIASFVGVAAGRRLHWL
jgi:hypothetical protein